MGDRQLVTLDRPECLALLAAHGFGRVVAAIGDGRTPIIRPVHYCFDPVTNSIVFRTLEGSKFHALVHSAHATFEIDDRCADDDTGWSVIVSGNTEEITGAGEIERLNRLGGGSWPGGISTPHWIRIHARTISGRRLVAVAGARATSGAPSGAPPT